MSGTGVARSVVKAAAETVVTLDHDARFLRRKRLTTDAGWTFLVDLPQVTSVDEGDAFHFTDGTLVGVRAAPEALLAITGPNLTELAWHIGNRHCPCQIEADRLFIKADPVLTAMLRGLGATLADITAPFRPTGGAYGLGRTHGHDHGHSHSHDNITRP